MKLENAGRAKWLGYSVRKSGQPDYVPHLNKRAITCLSASTTSPHRASDLSLAATTSQQHFRISDNGNCDGHQHKHSKLNDAITIHSDYEVEFGSLFKLSAMIVVNCITS
jgi:hypothetical protein